MRVPVRRKFGLLDAMIVVAAMAVWLAATRHLASKTNQRSLGYDGHPRHLIHFAHDLISGLLFLLSLACLLIRLRPPRPARRRLWCQPGFAACAAAVLGMVIQAMHFVIFMHTRLAGWGWYLFVMQVFWRNWTFCGPAVAGAWLALIVAGCWRAERSGIDRLGRVLGACWLVEMLIADNPFLKVGWILINLLTGTRS
jgi:hypothetical protein